jgi:hypothetical protein
LEGGRRIEYGEDGQVLTDERIRKENDALKKKEEEDMKRLLKKNAKFFTDEELSKCNLPIYAYLSFIHYVYINSTRKMIPNLSL